METKTAVVLLCEAAITISAIPPLSPQPPAFFDHNPIHVPALFTLPFPDDIYCIKWQTMSARYFGPSHLLYFDILCHRSKLHRFQIILKPDLSAASFHIISISEVTLHWHDFEVVSFDDDSICKDTLVTWWINDCLDQHQSGVYTGLTSARLSNVISQRDPAAKLPLPNIG